MKNKIIIKSFNDVFKRSLSKNPFSLFTCFIKKRIKMSF